LKILLDTCVWGKAMVELSQVGHDVVWAGNWNQDPGDEEILARAHLEGRLLVTLDKDFGELAVVHGLPHRGILRLVGISAKLQAIVIQKVLEKYGEALTAGGIVTADPGRVRIRHQQE
jgi:predicted nuclease of predicted toxin-antitoxin system